MSSTDLGATSHEAELRDVQRVLGVAPQGLPALGEVVHGTPYLVTNEARESKKEVKRQKQNDAYAHTTAEGVD